MDLIISTLSALFLFFIFVIFLFMPAKGLNLLILTRASIGPLARYTLPLVPVKINILSLFGMFTMGVGAMYLLFKRNWSLNAFFILYTITTAWFFFTILFAPVKNDAIIVFFRFFAPILFFVIVITEMKTVERINGFLKMSIFSSIVPIAYGFYQYATGTGFYRNDIMRINSFFVLPNPYAFYLTVIIVLSILMSNLGNKKMIYRLIVILAIIALLTTGTRTALFGLLVCMGLYGLMNRKFVMIFFGSFLILLLLIGLPNIRARLTEPIKSFISEDGGIDLQQGLDTDQHIWEQNTFQSRLTLWKMAVKAFRQKPIQGSGIGSIKTILGNECHNDYIRLLSETGIVGLFLYIISFFTLLLGRFKAWRHSRDTKERQILSCVISLIVMHMVFMIGDNVIMANTYLYYLFSIFAISYKWKTAEARNTADTQFKNTRSVHLQQNSIIKAALS